MTFRLRLASLVALALAPPVALAAYNLVHWRSSLEAGVSAEALARARLVSGQLEQMVSSTRFVMETAVDHPAVPNDEKQCAEHFREVVARIPFFRELALIDRAGHFRCSSISIPAQLDVRDRFYFTEPLRTNRLTIGKLTIGRVTKEASIHLTMPYASPDRAFDGIIAVILNPEELARNLTGLLPEQRLVVLDRDGGVVSALPGDAEGASEIAKAAFRESQHATEGTVEVQTATAGTQLVGYVGAEAANPPGLLVAVALDLKVALAGVRRAAFENLVLGAIAILFAIGGAWAAGQHLIRRPVRMMIRTAQRRESGDRTAKFPALPFASELGQLSAALASMSETREKLLDDKEFLLRELHHRVMNSLNVLTSMLALQSKHTRTADAKDQLARAQWRVLAMASVYKFLYRAETGTSVNLSEFLRAVCSDSVNAYAGGRPDMISYDLDPISAPSNVAASLAVLVHELVTNTLKHGYPDTLAGPISLSCKRAFGEMMELRYADRGVGFAIPPGETDGSLGTQLIRSTVRQFRGSMDVHPLSPGVEFTFHFPLAEVSPPDRVRS